MGEISLAEEMILAAIGAGANVVKFQYWDPKYLKKGAWDEDGRREIYNKAALTLNKTEELINISSKNNCEFLISVFGTKGAEDILSLGQRSIKIPSHETTNGKLLEFCAKNFDFIYFSAGASTQKEIEAANYDIKAEKAGYYPDVDGELSYLQRDQREEIGGEAEDARAVIKVSWAFETGGGQNARTRRTKAQYAEAIAKNQENIRVVEGEIRRAYAEYETAQKQLSLINKRESAAQDLLEAYKVQFEGAVVRLLQIMQAENQLFNTQLEAITADYRNILSHYIVLGSMGKINEGVNSPMMAISSGEPKIIKEISSEEMVPDTSVISEISEEGEKPEISKALVDSEITDVPEVPERQDSAPSQEIISSGSEVLLPSEQMTRELMPQTEDSPVAVSRVSRRIDVEQYNSQEERYPQDAIEETPVAQKISKDIDVQFHMPENKPYNPAEMENDVSTPVETSGHVDSDSE